MDRYESARQRAISVAMKRKEEYLGARVPKELRDRVLRRAKEQGIPVSILIRNILMDAFPEESRAGASMAGAVEEKAVANTKYHDVLGWESIRLNRGINCSGCNAPMAAGESATLGVGGREPVLLCAICSSKI